MNARLSGEPWGTIDGPIRGAVRLLGTIESAALRSATSYSVVLMTERNMRLEGGQNQPAELVDDYFPENLSPRRNHNEHGGERAKTEQPRSVQSQAE